MQHVHQHHAHHTHHTHHAHHAHHAAGSQAVAVPQAVSPRVALAATLHCLTGCAVGEVLGMVIGTAAGLGAAQTVVLSVALAFAFGYLLTMLPLLRANMPAAVAARTALAADTASIAIMEVVDNLVMLVIPGAMSAGLASPLFWGSLALSLGLAGVAAYPVNLYLLRRGRGHAVVHAHHATHGRAH